MQFKKLFTVASLVASALAAPAAVPVNGVEPVDFSEMEVQTFDFVAYPGAVAADLEDRAVAASLKDRSVIGGIVTTIVMNTAKDLLAPYVEQGITLAANLIKDLSNWNDAREQFTKATVLSMWQNNPDPVKYPAVICYVCVDILPFVSIYPLRNKLTLNAQNMDYHLSDTNGIAGWTKAQLKKSLLKTDYDCMYMTAPNTFQGDGDGGFINFASLNDKSRCTFSSQDRQIRCQ